MIWTWRNKWENINFASCANTAILALPGPSLADAPKALQGPQRTVFGINTSYPTIRPDYWLGMDHSYCYDQNLLDESFIKLYRGTYSSVYVGDIALKETTSAYFADIQVVEKGQTMFDLPENKGLAWHNHTLGVALHFIITLGAKRIGLLGCDLGGTADYCHGLTLTYDQRRRNRRLYAQQAEFLKELSIVAKVKGIELFSMTKHSCINEFLDYIPVEEIINPVLKDSDLRYVLDKPNQSQEA